MFRLKFHNEIRNYFCLAMRKLLSIQFQAIIECVAVRAFFQIKYCIVLHMKIKLYVNDINFNFPLILG